MVQVCERCHYEFERMVKVNQCPDCGKRDGIRPATDEEAEAYRRRKQENVWLDPAPVAS